MLIIKVIKMLNFPDDRKYDDGYSWVKEEGEFIIMGFTEPAVKLVTEFIFIQLPDKNKIIKKGDVYVSVESAKWSGHIQSPISGTIIVVNDSLFDEPSRLNKKPYDEWIIKIKPNNTEEYQSLLNSKEKKDAVK
jgi:glycine cleavage system H protein